MSSLKRESNGSKRVSWLEVGLRTVREERTNTRKCDEYVREMGKWSPHRRWDPKRVIRSKKRVLKNPQLACWTLECDPDKLRLSKLHAEIAEGNAWEVMQSLVKSGRLQENAQTTQP